MELKDVIHFYLGCEVTVPDSDEPRIIEGVGKSYIFTTGNGYYAISMNTQPILRLLPDLTEEECRNLNWIFPVSVYVAKNFIINGMTPEEFKYLLSIGADLFGLIESGQAINKTTL